MPLYKDITGDRDFARNADRVAAYRNYLKALSKYLPDETKEFVLSDWYYSDPDRCPHDAWVDRVEILEPSSEERQENRKLEIHVRLLSASHAGRIHFQYLDVSGYRLDGEWPLFKGRTKRGDWLADEITLASDGQMIHEILFSSKISWQIRCRSIRCEYLPTPEKTN